MSTDPFAYHNPDPWGTLMKIAVTCFLIGMLTVGILIHVKPEWFPQ